MSCELQISEIIRVLPGQIRHQGTMAAIRGVSTDTREDLSGKAFFALKGERFDAHDFLRQAIDRKAGCLIVSRWETQENELLKGLKAAPTVIQVPDTLRALQDLAQHWRNQVKARIVAITGSNGKTTTKEFTSTIASRYLKTVASPASFNNHIGVPLTLLSISKDTEVAVVEMGMNHQGELQRLCQMARPDVALVTLVGRAHIGELGSQEAVAEAKEELYNNSPGAVGIFNLDNIYTRKMWEKALKGSYQFSQIITFSQTDRNADVWMEAVEMSLTSLEVRGQIGKVSGQVRLEIFGRQNLYNVLASVSLGLALGLTPEKIWTVLPLCHTGWGRNQLIDLKCGARVLFDAYNANPESMKALLENIKELKVPGKKIAVLGEMLELGAEAEQAHQELGHRVGTVNFDWVWFWGPSRSAFEAGIRSSNFPKNLVISGDYDESLANEIGSVLNHGDVVFMKGSRGMKLERALLPWEPLNFEAKK